MNAAASRPPRAFTAAKSLQKQESQRCLAVSLVFVIYALALAEGALRKWVVPGLSTPLYFLRDPAVIGLYAYVAYARLLRIDGWARAWFAFAALASFVSILPYAAQGLGVQVWGFGVRTYWLYMPLAFVVGSTFNRDDVYRFIRMNLFLAVPYAALIVVQVRSPVGSLVNASISGDEGIAMVAYGLVRPYGVFTYTGQNVIFVGSLVAMFFAYILTRGIGFGNLLFVILAAIAVASAAVLTGSRAIYFVIGASLLLTVAGSLFTRRFAAGFKVAAKVGLSIALAAALFVTLYGDAYQAMQERFQNAARSEGGITNRLDYELLSFIPALETAPLLGHGIGLGTPALTGYLNRPQLEFGESDLTRNINELGVMLGIVMLGMRFAFSIFLLRNAMVAARYGMLALLPLAGYVAVYLAQGQITHSTLNGFQVWLMTGLLLALARTDTTTAPTKIRSRRNVSVRSRRAYPGVRSAFVPDRSPA